MENQSSDQAESSKTPGKIKYLVRVGITRAIICVIGIIILVRSLGYFEIMPAFLLIIAVLVAADICMITMAQKRGIRLNTNDAFFVNAITMALPSVVLCLLIIFSSVNCQDGWFGGSCKGFGIALVLFILFGAGCLYVVVTPLTILANYLVQNNFTKWFRK